MYAFDSNKSIHLSKKMMHGKKFGSTLSKQAHMERKGLTIITEESRRQIESNIKYWQNAKDLLIFGLGEKIGLIACFLITFIEKTMNPLNIMRKLELRPVNFLVQIRQAKLQH